MSEIKDKNNKMRDHTKPLVTIQNSRIRMNESLNQSGGGLFPRYMSEYVEVVRRLFLGLMKRATF